MLEKNSIHSAVIDGMTSEGLGVCRVDGRVVFVHGGARGDGCLVRIVKAGEKVSYGIIEELTAPSPHRIENACPAFPQCGGCVYRHIGYSEELDIKRGRAEDAMRRIGGFDIRAEEVFASPETERYRNKSAMPVGWSEGKPVTGFYRPRTHEIIPVESCLLQKKEADTAAGVLRRWLIETGDTSVRHIVTRTGSGGALVCLVGTGEPPRSAARLADMLRKVLPDLVGVVWSVHTGRDNVVFGKEERLVWGKAYTEDALCGMTFRISARSFYQVNRPQAERIYDRAAEYAGDFRSAVDLFCGTGTLTLRLAKNGGRIRGVEIVREAVLDARANALRNGIDADFDCMDASEAAGLRAEVVVVDPPRKGLSPQAASAVLSIAPDRVVYVSCDPATLARDALFFAENGYIPARLTVADMFPRTSHVECVLLLSRKDGEEVY